jgi:putative membrane protein
MSEPAATPKAVNAAVKQSAKKLAASAGALASSAHVQEDSADRRTVLAADRTVLAAERTYAAWVRTSLAALASGVGAPALLSDVVAPVLAKATGSVLIVFAGFCLVAAVWRDLKPGPPPPTPDLKPLPAALLVALNGFLLLVALAALVGVWAADFRHLFAR